VGSELITRSKETRIWFG